MLGGGFFVTPTERERRTTRPGRCAVIERSELVDVTDPVEEHAELSDRAEGERTMRCLKTSWGRASLSACSF